ncbi:MAG: RHS repeat protein [Solobacterium sp.]|nr:RHS repeat protein [Solobacterium sp.]
MNVKKKLMLICLSIMIVFSMSCSSSERKYEHYLDFKPYETALKELIRSNREARKNNDPVLKQYPYSVKSTTDPGSAAGSSGGYAYHAYSFYESGKLKTDMCYYKRGYLKRPELNFIKEYYDSGNIKSFSSFTYSNAEITEYRDQPHYLEPPGDIQYVINVYLRPEDPFEIERQLPPGHNRILRTTEIWAGGKYVTEFDENGLVVSFEAESANTIEQIMEEEQNGDLLTVRYGYKREYESGDSMMQFREQISKDGVLLARSNQQYKTTDPPHVIQRYDYQYDDDGRLCGYRFLNAEDESGPYMTVEFHVNDSGQLLDHAKEDPFARKFSTRFYYSTNGDLIRAEGYRNNDYELLFAYDEDHKLLQAYDNDGRMFEFTYDEEGRKKTRSYSIDGTCYLLDEYVYE